MKNKKPLHYTGIPILDEIVIDQFVWPFITVVLIILMPCWLPLVVIAKSIQAVRQSAEKYHDQK